MTPRAEAYSTILKRIQQDHPNWSVAKQNYSARKMTDQFLSQLRKGSTK